MGYFKPLFPFVSYGFGIAGIISRNNRTLEATEGQFTVSNVHILEAYLFKHMLVSLITSGSEHPLCLKNIVDPYYGKWTQGMTQSYGNYRSLYIYIVRSTRQ